MTSISARVLELFNDEVSHDIDRNGNEIPLELDSSLYELAGDDLHAVLDRYEKEFNVDLSNVDWSCYYPWQNLPFFTRHFKVKREEVEATRLPLTIRMFAESAEAGRWLYN